MIGFEPPRYPAPVWARRPRTLRDRAADLCFLVSGIALTLAVIGLVH